MLFESKAMGGVWTWKSNANNTIEKSWLKADKEALLYDMVKWGGVITFIYEGVERVAEPWCLGTTTKGKAIRMWVRRGSVSAGDTFKGWRLFKLDKMQDVKWTKEFIVGERPLYNPDDKGMKSIKISANADKRKELQKTLVKK